MFTSQLIFDTVLAHLRNQGQRSYDGHMCLYRGPDGLQCAAGCLIPDDLYVPEMEGKSFANPIFDGFLGEFRSLIFDLQCVHDKSDIWEESFKAVADNHHLEYQSV